MSQQTIRRTARHAALDFQVRVFSQDPPDLDLPDLVASATTVSCRAIQRDPAGRIAG